jgi:hypothetical protein
MMCSGVAGACYTSYTWIIKSIKSMMCSCIASVLPLRGRPLAGSPLGSGTPPREGEETAMLIPGFDPGAIGSLALVGIEDGRTKFLEVELP